MSPAAGGPAQGAFGGDVEGVGAECLDEGGEAAGGEEGERMAAVGGHADGGEAVGAEDFDAVAHDAEFGSASIDKGADDAVDLGAPGVGDDQDVHGVWGDQAGSAGMTASRLRRRRGG